MEQKKWEKDQTPYVVFICTKCQQYSYVRNTQKTKKCLRCGRTHQVKNILDKGEIVYGMTEAVNKVKQLQNSLGEAQFSTETEFIVSINNRIIKKVSKPIERIGDFDGKFRKCLTELSSLYSRFPLHLIKIMARDYEIPPSELKLLINKYLKNGVLQSTGKEKSYFTLVKR
ncbi:MAG: DUF1922 domain-containing protein [Promethearchaeota archaeon]|jgi:hypothetical protein